MSEVWNAAILGVLEGLTEFIPVSSTGHLILVGDALRMGGERPEFQTAFDVFIQMGAIAAVLAAFPQRIAGLVPTARARARGGFHGCRGLGLIALASAPALALAWLLRAWIEAWLFRPVTVALALAAGAVWMLWADRPGRAAPGPARHAPEVCDLDQLTWRHALRIGCFQCLALWPGMSRSVSTILGGMHAGLDRRTAAQFSFFIAVPVLGAAALYVLTGVGGSLPREGVGLFALGTILALVVAWLTVRWFVRFVSHHTLRGFAWYRLALAALVLAIHVWKN